MLFGRPAGMFGWGQAFGLSKETKAWPPGVQENEGLTPGGEGQAFVLSKKTKA
jgi:hypothetical protein